MITAIICVLVALLAVSIVFVISRGKKPQVSTGRIVTEDQVIEKMNTILRYNNEERF